MKPLKKWSIYFLCYIAGILTVILGLKIYTWASSTAEQQIKNSIGLIQLPNNKAHAFSNNQQVQQFNTKPTGMNAIIQQMQQNIQQNLNNSNGLGSFDQDATTDSMMGQFIEMRKRMLQLLQEETGSANFNLDHDTMTAELDLSSREDGQNFYFDLNIEKLNPDSLKIDIKDGYINISAEMKKESTQESQLGTSTQSSIASLSKSIPIPYNGLAKKTKIDQNKSILTISIPKKNSP